MKVGSPEDADAKKREVDVVNAKAAAAEEELHKVRLILLFVRGFPSHSRSSFMKHSRMSCTEGRRMLCVRQSYFPFALSHEESL